MNHERAGDKYGRVTAYLQLMRVDKPVGSLLLLWPTLWGLYIAGDGRPAAPHVAFFIVGVFIMRALGCVINDIFDRNLDQHVQRTRARPLASGRLQLRQAVMLLLVLGAAALATVWILGWALLPLALIGLAISAVYPLGKRIMHAPQLMLGMAFSWGIPMAFMAETSTLPPLCWLLFAANLCWVVAYDTMYAMSDRADDVRIGIKSTAILFGRYDRAWLVVFQSLAGLLFAVVGVRAGLNAYYFGALAVAGGFAWYQIYLCRHREREACLCAFVNNIWLGGAIFAGIVLSYLPVVANG